MATCKHCGAQITHNKGIAWHDEKQLFPQYCFVDFTAGSRLHEPAPQSMDISDLIPEWPNAWN